MRVLIVGTVPPPVTPFGLGLARASAVALKNGEQIDVLSPDPRSAAHLHADLSGVRLAVHLAVRARRYDALILRIEPNLPLAARVGSFERALSLLALGAALKLWRDVTIRLDSPIPIPGGPGGRAAAMLWQGASRVVVANIEDQEQLLKVQQMSESRITIEEPPALASEDRREAWSSIGEEPTRQAVLNLVRTRSAVDRATMTARSELGVGLESPLSSSVFSSPTVHHRKASGLIRVVLERARTIPARLRSA